MTSFDDEVDTVTPLDGDGRNVVGLDEQFGGSVPYDDSTGNINPAEFDTAGRTRVATPIGYRFASNDKALPVVDSDGVKMTREQADAVIAESDNLVFLVDNDENEEV